jgi:hypothetical protein
MRLIGRLGLLVVAAIAGAPATLSQTVVVKPRINTNPPPVVSPTLPAQKCVPESTGGETSCPPSPTVPPLTVKPLLPPPIMPAPPPDPRPRPEAAFSLARPLAGAEIGKDKVLSYFQHGVTRVDTRKAFGFVLLPKSAVTGEEKTVHARFCDVMLASLDFAAPEEAARRDALATYWPIVAGPTRGELEAAFEAKHCPRLLAWYDHSLARSVAARAGLSGMSGPLLITWPSESAQREDRDPLIVDFAKADHERATKALAYWFGQLRTNPKLWTSRIREGTIRAELADAINDTAGVMVAVLAGKWESVTAVSGTP